MSSKRWVCLLILGSVRCRTVVRYFFLKTQAMIIRIVVENNPMVKLLRKHLKCRMASRQYMHSMRIHTSLDGQVISFCDILLPCFHKHIRYACSVSSRFLDGRM